MPTANSSPPPGASPTLKPRLRLEFLDGLRGLAALYVVFHHAYMDIYSNGYFGKFPSIVARLVRWIYTGQFPVDIFIVLSGFCLMLPIALDPGRGLRGGVLEYFRRRARRILPPYYAALVLCLAVIALIPVMNHVHHIAWDNALPAWTRGVVLSHLFLVHNWSYDWSSRVDYPMWSIATEWQIYFLFPFVLIPLWRRLGIPALLAASAVIGYAPHYVFHGSVDCASYHLVILFALGMAAAAVSFAHGAPSARWRERFPWGITASALAIVLLVASERWLPWVYTSFSDILAGVASACLLVFCTRHAAAQNTARRPVVLQILESRLSVDLGAFSYSLYLVHAPVLTAFVLALGATAHHLTLGLLLTWLIGVPIALFAAYLFHIVFERPFMAGHPHNIRQAAKAAAISPAP